MYGYGYSPFSRVVSSSGGTPVDPDAQAFITAAAITDPTQQSAINTLVTDLKGYGVWTKMKAVYPFVGGTASSHKFNLKDPRDLDAAFRLVFNGGVTHTSNGITGSINGYADTFLNNNLMAANNAHISIYSRTNNSGSYCDIGSWNGGFGSMIYSSTFNSFQSSINSNQRVIQSNTNSNGFYLVTRLTTNSQTGQKNSTQYITSSVRNNYITTSFKILRPGDYNGEYSNRNLAFASIGDGLLDSEAANFYTAVQAFQVSLSRNI